MLDAVTSLGSLTGMSINPISGVEAKTLPKNSFSHGILHTGNPYPTLLTYFIAWSIGRSIALSRSQKLDPIDNLLKAQNGVLLFTGKIIFVNRKVGSGFTRGDALLESFSDSPSSSSDASSLFVEFENENLSAVLREKGKPERLVAVCPDLIQFMDKANGAPLGTSDYKYGMRVNVIALRSPPIWTTPRGLEMGGPKAFE